MNKTLDIITPIPFGKYRGELLGSIIECDPSYVNWIVEKTDYRLTENALKYLEENL